MGNRKAKDKRTQMEVAPTVTHLVNLNNELEQALNQLFASRTWRFGQKVADILRKCGLPLSDVTAERRIREIHKANDFWLKALLEGHGIRENAGLLEFVDSDDEHEMDGSVLRWEARPLFSVVMPVYNVDPRWLMQAIESVRHQMYDRWELCIADDASTREDTLDCLRALDDERIHVRFCRSNGGIAAASNEAIALASGDYIALLDNDDELHPRALVEVANHIRLTEADFVYTDEHKIDENGRPDSPHFKPDYAPDHLLSQNYICHLAVIHRDLVRKVGGFHSGYDGSQDHDLFLRVVEHARRIGHVPRTLYRWRAVSGSTAASFTDKDYPWDAGVRAVRDALKRRGIEGTVEKGRFAGTYRVRRAIHGKPLVSIIIPFRDEPELLKQCLNSILERTSYDRFEVIGVDNGSEKAETKEVMARFAERDDRVRFLEYPYAFNFSAINNFAVEHASGEHVLLLNNDTEVSSSGWLDALLEHSQREEVGAVGAKLLYPDDTLQHGGVIVGLGGVAGHSHKGIPGDNPGYFFRPQIIQNLSAVTAACLMVKRSLYQELGGLDAENLAIAFNDIDFCLRLREHGKLNVYTPYSVLWHHESKSRGFEDTWKKQQRFAKECAYMKKRHRRILENGDPYYNPHLTLKTERFVPAAADGVVQRFRARLAK